MWNERYITDRSGNLTYFSWWPVPIPSPCAASASPRLRDLPPEDNGNGQYRNELFGDCQSGLLVGTTGSLQRFGIMWERNTSRAPT